MDEIIYIILLTPVFISLFWIIQLSSGIEKGDWSKLYMSLFLLSHLLLYLGPLFFFRGHIHLWSRYYLIMFVCVYLQYPLLYTYLYYIANNKITASFLIRHFTAPLIILFILLAKYKFFLSPEAYDLLTKNLLHKSLHTVKELRWAYLIDMILRNGFLLQVGLYLLLINKKTNQVKNKILDNYSNTEGVQINWIRAFNVLVVFSVLWSILFNMKESAFLFDDNMKVLFPVLVLSCFLWYFGYMGNKQKRIVLFDDFDPDNNQTESDTFQEIYETIQMQVQELMERDLIYTDPDLTLDKLSAAVGSNRSYVSKMINKAWGMNFNHYINHYRVKKAKELIISDADKPLNEIALECGFFSYTSFYRRFKEIENISPTALRQKERLA